MQYVIGKPKTGKTTYLKLLFLRAMREGGAAFFDFSGDVDPILELIPPTRIGDVLIFDPTDSEHPIGLNLLHRANDPVATATAVVEAVKSAWRYEDGSTPVLDLYLRNAVLSLCRVPDASLLGTIPLLINNLYREKVVRHVDDPVLRLFWNGYYDEMSARDRRHDTASTLNKLFALFTDPVVRNILGQVRTSFTLTDTPVVVATFPPSLSREVSSFLATVLLYTLPDIPTLLDGGHYLGTATVLHRERTVFSHEHLGQFATPSMHKQIIGSASSIVSFRIGIEDNEKLAKEFELHRPDNTEKLYELWDFHYVRKDASAQYRKLPFVHFPKYPIQPTAVPLRRPSA